MEIKRINDSYSVSGQISPADIDKLVEAGIRSIVCNRPDGEGADQPNFSEIEQAAQARGMETYYLPVTSGKVLDEDAAKFGKLMQTLPQPVHAYCRSGMRSTTLWALNEGARQADLQQILKSARDAGYDMSGVVQRIAGQGVEGAVEPVGQYDIVIVGGGAAGIAAASSIRQRSRNVSIAIIDPAELHYYQPGWTFVGAGVFSPEKTERRMAALIPKGVEWIKSAVAAFDPKNDAVILEGCRAVKYKRLVVAPGIKLDWDAIEGLPDTLGRNGVTSNYRFDLAPYTWELVKNMTSGRALFTQPPMPIKCAGAPQKAMYLSADWWYRQGVLGDIDVEFYNSGAVLFGIKEYVPALMEYVKKYNASLNFQHRLFKIDGPAQKAWFEHTDDNGNTEVVERTFDMIHVCPPQTAPDFIRVSPLADEAGWVDVDQTTLRHKKYDNIWSLGDVINAPNAKTAAAARKQAPVVATNVLSDMGLIKGVAHYDGYGSCPLTVERGKVVLAEFGYGGKLLPSFPRWLVNGTRPSRLSWLLKERVMPPLYWKGMLRGREWLANPVISDE
ncbi:MAG: TIGR01244 family sulfur transferase [Porticoccus sp.]|jgi:sulfide:quinone oxidoreductase|uniref:TIGR01244 family sulfur transferase n=1 Tax=Porticoccus sp. TaxID=2024853 RepID=UPI00329826DE